MKNDIIQIKRKQNNTTDEINEMFMYFGRDSCISFSCLQFFASIWLIRTDILT